MDWTITIIRSKNGEEIFNALVEEDVPEVKSMEEFENSMKALLRLTRRQRDRVLVPLEYR